MEARQIQSNVKRAEDASVQIAPPSQTKAAQLKEENIRGDAVKAEGTKVYLAVIHRPA
jgi:hypothetical protein